MAKCARDIAPWANSQCRVRPWILSPASRASSTIALSDESPNFGHLHLAPAESGHLHLAPAESGPCWRLCLSGKSFTLPHQQPPRPPQALLLIWHTHIDEKVGSTRKTWPKLSWGIANLMRTGIASGTLLVCSTEEEFRNILLTKPGA